MARPYHHMIALIFIAVVVTACGSAPPTAVPSTPIATVAAPTVAPSTVPPTPTALPATATDLPPTTTTPPAEKAEPGTNQDHSNGMEANRMNLQIGENVLTATLVENSSVDALKEVLSQGPITVNMRDYGSMEKVGPLGMDLPRNDEQITTEARDIILYLLSSPTCEFRRRRPKWAIA